MTFSYAEKHPNQVPPEELVLTENELELLTSDEFLNGSQFMKIQKKKIGDKGNVKNKRKRRREETYSNYKRYQKKRKKDVKEKKKIAVLEIQSDSDYKKSK